MPPDDETPPKRPWWVAWALIAVMALAVLGMLNLGWRMLPAAVRGADAGAAGAPVAAGAAQASTAALPGRTAVEGGDCLRCHGMDRNYVGRRSGRLLSATAPGPMRPTTWRARSARAVWANGGAP